MTAGEAAHKPGEVLFLLYLKNQDSNLPNKIILEQSEYIMQTEVSYKLTIAAFVLLDRLLLLRTPDVISRFSEVLFTGIAEEYSSR